MSEPLTVEKVKEIQERAEDMFGDDRPCDACPIADALALCAGWLEKDAAIARLHREAEDALGATAAEGAVALREEGREVKRLREALTKYGARHLDGCAAAIPGQPCSCGFDAALAEKE